MTETHSFFDRPQAVRDDIKVGDQTIPFATESVTNPALGIGGAYGGWGESYDNTRLRGLVSKRRGEWLADEDVMNLSELGFESRHHIQDLSPAEHLEVELQVGARMLARAAEANHWSPSEVDAVLVGMSGPVADDFVSQICRRAGIPDRALKVSMHKACDGSVGCLNLALNPQLGRPGKLNVAEELKGKKVLLGGIEGLSRFTSGSRDKYALQLFGNAAGIIGVVPGETFNFLVGKEYENYDEEGVLAVRMYYPHSRKAVDGSLIEVTQDSPNTMRVAGMMHEPDHGGPIAMAGPMGMVKLFVRTGVKVVTDVINEYTALMERVGTPDRKISVGIVHHANYKINQLKAKQLQGGGIEFPMPWLMKDFGNVSAASNMVVFLRQLQQIKPGDHVLFDGFGAGTYYDVLAVRMGA